MAHLEIRITHVAWRGGRPRFVPGPALRRIGFTGQDLKTPDGAWMSADQALAWVKEKELEISKRRSAATIAAAAGKRLRPIGANGRRLLTTEDVLQLWFRECPKMQTEAGSDVGRRQMKVLSPASIRSYKHFDKLLGEFDGQLYTAPVEALTKPICYDLFERLWQERGLANARATIATLRAALSWAMKKGRVRFHVNPCFDLDMQTPAPRVRCYTPTEAAAWIAAADRVGRPEMGDSFALGLWTGQRQADRLTLVDVGLVDGRHVFRQAKTGAIVAIRPAPALISRLEAAKSRRVNWPVQPLETIVDERTRRPWKSDWYRHVFMEVRAAAAKTCPTLADATDQDLRDTAVTWLARAQCTLFEICAITGHSHQSAEQVLKHYLASHPELADNAIAKLITWYDGQNI